MKAIEKEAHCEWRRSSNALTYTRRILTFDAYNLCVVFLLPFELEICIYEKSRTKMSIHRSPQTHMQRPEYNDKHTNHTQANKQKQYDPFIKCTTAGRSNEMRIVERARSSMCRHFHLSVFPHICFDAYRLCLIACSPHLNRRPIHEWIKADTIPPPTIPPRHAH